MEISEEGTNIYEDIIEKKAMAENSVIAGVLNTVAIVDLKVAKQKTNPSPNERVGIININYNDREYKIYIDLWKIDKHTFYLYNDDISNTHLSTDCKKSKMDNKLFIKDIKSTLEQLISEMAEAMSKDYILNETLFRIEEKIMDRIEDKYGLPESKLQEAV